MNAQIAQLVEQRTENPRVTGSIPVLGTQDYKDGDNIHTDTDDLLYNAPTFTEMKVGWDIKNARVVEWYYVALPRRRSRVRSPSRARLKALLRNQEGFFDVRLAAHVSNRCKSGVRPVAGRT